MSKIVYQYTKQLIPFVISGKKFDDIENFKVDDIVKWEKFSFKTNHLLPSISAKISSDTPLEIGRSYTLNDKLRKKYSLPNLNTKMFLKVRQKDDDKEYGLKLTKITLHVFETYIGFLELEWAYDTSISLDEYLTVNYFLSEYKSSDNVLSVPVGKEEYKDIKIVDVVDEILSEFETKTGFDGRTQLSFSDIKPLLYSYVLTDTKDEAFDNTLKKVQYNYKNSYKVKDCHSYSPFENSFWVSSLQATANLSYTTGDEQTDNFFKTNFVSITKNNYFFLYLLSLNQRFTLLKRIDQISQEKIKKSRDDLDMLREQMNVTSELLAKLKLYDVRTNFSVPSFVDHINEYYEMIKKEQEIPNLEKELERKTSSLKSILSTYEERVKILENYQKVKLTVIVFIITQVIGTLSMFKSVWDIVEKLSGLSIRANLYLVTFPIVLTLAFFIGVTIQLVLKIKELNKIKKEINRKS